MKRTLFAAALMAALSTQARAQSTNYLVNDTVAVGTSSGAVFTQSYARGVTVLQLCATTASDVWLNLSGGTAVVGSGVPIWAGSCTFFSPAGMPVPNSAITAIAAVGQSISRVGG